LSAEPAIHLCQTGTQITFQTSCTGQEFRMARGAILSYNSAAVCKPPSFCDGFKAQSGLHNLFQSIQAAFPDIHSVSERAIVLDRLLGPLYQMKCNLASELVITHKSLLLRGRGVE
jgi:hypothetical protein